MPLTLEQEADKLLRRWAARQSALTGTKHSQVMRDAGIISPFHEAVIRQNEIPMSMFDDVERGSRSDDDSSLGD